MITNRDLAVLAESMGVRLVRHNGGPKGFYHHPSRTISTRRGLSVAQYKSTLAHELGHAVNGDTPTTGHYHARQERRADEYAARLLLDGADVHTIITANGGHLAPAAYELEVTTHLLKVWLKQKRNDHDRIHPSAQRTSI